MNIKRKIFISLFLILILLTNLSFASYSTVTMNVVEEPVCTIELGENSKFEKKLISKDLNNKEVTIQLQVKNDEVVNKPTGEIMLVLDNSDSMNTTVDGTKTRKELIFDSAKTLVSNLLKDNEELKIGIVSFSTNTDISNIPTVDQVENECSRYGFEIEPEKFVEHCKSRNIKDWKFELYTYSAAAAGRNRNRRKEMKD